MKWHSVACTMSRQPFRYRIERWAEPRTAPLPGDCTSKRPQKRLMRRTGTSLRKVLHLVRTILTAKLWMRSVSITSQVKRLFSAGMDSRG